MQTRINYYWRLFGTGFSFFVFGAIGILFWGILFPLFAKFLGRGITKKRRTRWLMHRIFQCYMNMMRCIGILDYQVSGVEHLTKPSRVIVANHPCLLDIVFLLSQTPNATCIVKPSLIHNPFMRIPIRAMGYIYVEEPELLLAHCKAELQEGGSLIIFPEGTRTTPNNIINPFQRGAAAIALEAKAHLLPVTLTCVPTTLTKHEKWYHIPQKRFTLNMIVGDDIPITLFNPANRSLATRQINRQLESYFIAQLKTHEKPSV